jgi:hypothetical protein
MEGCFRQEGYFLYMFGVEEEDYFGAVTPGGRSLLFMPRQPPEHAVWMGPIAGTPVRWSWATSVLSAFIFEDSQRIQNTVLAAGQTHDARCGLSRPGGRATKVRGRRRSLRR